MSMSGIEVSKECEAAHDRQKKVKDVQWTIYKIGDCKGQEVKGRKGSKQEIVVEKCTKRSFGANDVKDKTADEVNTCDHALWLKLMDDLPEDEPRYAVFDYVGPTKSGAFEDMRRFVAWSPDCSSIKSKMIYASTRSTLKKALKLEKETFLGDKKDIEEAFTDMICDSA